MANLLNVFSLPLEQPGTNIVEHIHDSARASEKAHKNLTIKINSSSEVERRTFTASRLLPMVWANIFRNAAQYAGDNPLLTVEISLIEDNFKVLIKDDGPGVPSHRRKLLFMRGGPLGEEEKGHGLYLSRLVLESPGGSIELMDSSEESGTIFAILIPATPYSQII